VSTDISTSSKGDLPHINSL